MTLEKAVQYGLENIMITYYKMVFRPAFDIPILRAGQRPSFSLPFLYSNLSLPGNFGLLFYFFCQMFIDIFQIFHLFDVLRMLSVPLIGNSLVLLSMESAHPAVLSASLHPVYIDNCKS